MSTPDDSSSDSTSSSSSSSRTASSDSVVSKRTKNQAPHSAGHDFTAVERCPLITCGVVGGPKVGKTCLVKELVTRMANEKQLSQIRWETGKPLKILATAPNGRPFVFSVTDVPTPGLEEDSYFPLMDGLDILILCFSVGDKRSFDQLEDIWIPFVNMIKQHDFFAPDITIVLAATKCDLLDMNMNEMASGPKKPLPLPLPQPPRPSPTVLATKKARRKSSRMTARRRLSKITDPPPPASPAPVTDTNQLVSRTRAIGLVRKVEGTALIELSVKSGWGVSKLIEKAVMTVVLQNLDRQVSHHDRVRARGGRAAKKTNSLCSLQ